MSAPMTTAERADALAFELRALCQKVERRTLALHTGDEARAALEQDNIDLAAKAIALTVFGDTDG